MGEKFVNILNFRMVKFCSDIQRRERDKPNQINSLCLSRTYARVSLKRDDCNRFERFICVSFPFIRVFLFFPFKSVN